MFYEEDEDYLYWELVRVEKTEVYHLHPTNDIASHKFLPNCWCQPDVKKELGEEHELWVHKAAKENVI